jgi:hypothetical protein
MRNKILESDKYIMMNYDYKDLIELYNFRKSQIKKIEIKEKKKIINRSIKIMIDDKAYQSLSEGMRAQGLLRSNISTKEHNKEEIAIWSKINQGMKKAEDHSYKYLDHLYRMI